MPHNTNLLETKTIGKCLGLDNQKEPENVFLTFRYLDLKYGTKVMFKLTSCEILHSNIRYWCIQHPTHMIIIEARGVQRSTSSSH